MRRFDEQQLNSIDRAERMGRLETPSMAGYRQGMSSFSVISRKLGALYDVPSDSRRDIEAALQTLDSKLD